MKSRSTALDNDKSNLLFPDRTIFDLSMTDLADKLSDALELGVGKQSNVPRLSPNSKVIAAFHSFIHGAADVATMTEKNLHVLRNDMMRLAFQVCA